MKLNILLFTKQNDNISQQTYTAHITLGKSYQRFFHDYCVKLNLQRTLN